MKIFIQRSHKNKGYGLLVTMFFLAIALTAVASVMAWATTTQRQAARNNYFNMAEAAAEGANENVIAQMERDFFNQTYNSAGVYETNLPSSTVTASWPVQFSFSDVSGTANRTSVGFGPSTYSTNWPAPLFKALGGQYAGLSAYVVTSTNTTTATTKNRLYDVAATVQQVVQFDAIPLFQFAIFYNTDLEISPGADMTVGGRTFVNGSTWADPGTHLTFGDDLNMTGQLYLNRNSTNDPQSNTSNPKVTFENSDGSTNPTNPPTLGATPLTMPTGTNNDPSALLALPPTGTDPLTSAGQQYFFNQADLIISNSSSGLLTAFYSNTNNAQMLTPIPYDVTNVTGSGKNKTTNGYYSFATNASFYDYRESDTVKAVQIDVGKFNSWLTNRNGGNSFNNQNITGSASKGHAINSIYVYNSIPLTTSQLPAVRMTDGATLPSAGLTVVTPMPIYVLGNYNATGSAVGTTNIANTAPAALMGDAITILSTAWKDTYTSSTSLSKRDAGDTTVNAATFEGIVKSTVVGNTKHYSGGVENFLRLLEDWSGNTLTYNGSIVVMFTSKYANNYWQTPGNYYDVPARNWYFDVNFKNENQLPPLTPSVKVLQRMSWNAY